MDTKREMAEGSVSPALRALEFYRYAVPYVKVVVVFVDETLTARGLPSGVGGMHWAVGRAGLEQRVKVVGAYDLNDGANRTYRHNFPDTPVRAVRTVHVPPRCLHLFVCTHASVGCSASSMQRDLASLDVHEVEAHAADIWLMSPPCQVQPRAHAGRVGSWRDTWGVLTASMAVGAR